MPTAFGSTYICKQMFSAMNFQKSTFFAHFTDDHLQGTLCNSSLNFKAGLHKSANYTYPQKSHQGLQ
jgi:hypothetical protein